MKARRFAIVINHLTIVLLCLTICGCGETSDGENKQKLENTVNASNEFKVKDNSENSGVNKQKMIDPSRDRYVAFGFDDFRESDFTMVLPLLEKYGFHATFNRDCYSVDDRSEDDYIQLVLRSGSEVGDHTWFHWPYFYSLPLCNGQNPCNIDGDQVEIPSNDDMRVDRGDGKNAFGLPVDQIVSEIDADYMAIDKSWRDLSDDDCQILRESFSIMMDPSGIIDTFDALSNQYCGTSGESRGSWNQESGTYTGGIFSGCHTSQNHEIWDRLALATKQYYKDKYGIDLKTWSWPGGKGGCFRYEKDGCYYYDRKCTKYYSYASRFRSSLTNKERSWADILRENGYTNTHDFIFPGRGDGRGINTEIMNQLFLNEKQSRIDAIMFPTNRGIDALQMESKYDESFFTGCYNREDKMYEDSSAFFSVIEKIRNETANGVINGELVDSSDTFSERCFLEGIMKYCKYVGINIISKNEAYNISFNTEFSGGE